LEAILAPEEPKEQDDSELCEPFVRAPKRRSDPDYYEVVNDHIEEAVGPVLWTITSRADHYNARIFYYHSIPIEFLISF